MLVANELHWTPSDNIVLARGEFPANVYPRLNQAPKGVEINWGEAKPGRLSTADFAKVVNRKMRVLSVSSVQFFDGYRSTLQARSALCKDHGILFVVDAIQSLGVFSLNVEEVGIDVLCADGHKCGNRLPRSPRNRHDLKTSTDAYRPTLQGIRTAWIFDSKLKGRRP
ncbi:MAG: aminotransferase class V-fold PLP-dependent enzyme [Gemmatimonadetes bacterium]|nr:aminotransferase class V-fold PLP-dependent enzyme [Gemmatimonadota bacterium]MBT5329209.1 aminotransferase class V-fold PLP-dependent enzyme [Gemmatimonadota bacterium]MBT5449862.1 aminotransferase class V-fold PLP-dependent enzyme [Gemmatimonadota bacterium]MBT5800100.1 aminotransferase class V-fold PLP-dependent enzyme [Gemmatimonadota bacterium]MBT6903954.1 aminotransferase class V-fold PLP-dependent enzyme [Gemmatimonadota bacterium]